MFYKDKSSLLLYLIFNFLGKGNPTFELQVPENNALLSF